MLSFVTQYWSLLVLVPAVAIGAITDISTGKIYNKLTYPVIAIALIGHTLAGGWNDGGTGPFNVGLLDALCGLLLGGGLLLLAVMAGGLHMGDVKLMAAVGALLGWHLTIVSLVYTFIAAALLSIAIILYRRVFWRTMGRLVSFVWQIITARRAVDPATADSPQAPFGLAIAIGSLAAVAEHLLRIWM